MGRANNFAPTMGWSVKFARDPGYWTSANPALLSLLVEPISKVQSIDFRKPLRIAGDGFGQSQVRIACLLTHKENGRLSRRVVYVAAPPNVMGPLSLTKGGNCNGDIISILARIRITMTWTYETMHTIVSY
ncbi:hypothetical protein BDY19DRAFT_1051967 [Irpex rosettiformis]|uniref:Uncharacterized protein n=1 Tax=Irpex rosettiformis TaxID=378272 RepID=A0ACB8TMA7_9APHY|nr:hypothetical protein BDY19DRAFT_1051967 [Irpex rosettiformis]